MTVAIVPTMNEAEHVAETVEGLLTYGQIREVIVADSSTDTTAFRALEAGAKVVEVPPDKGLRGAYRTAWKHVDPLERVLHFDVGHSLDDLEGVLDSDADIVIGSRFVSGASYEADLGRRGISQATALAFSLLARRRLHDWTSGFRAYSPRVRKYLTRQAFTCKGHAWQIESLYLAQHARYTIDEQPITYLASQSHLSRARMLEAADLWWEILRGWTP